MEYLGYIINKPVQNKKGKWNYLDVEFNDSDEFNQATSKMMNIMYKNDSDGKCMVLDGKGNKYALELVHATFDTMNNIIQVYPIDVKFLSQESRTEKKKL